MKYLLITLALLGLLACDGDQTMQNTSPQDCDVRYQFKATFPITDFPIKASSSDMAATYDNCLFPLPIAYDEVPHQFNANSPINYMIGPLDIPIEVTKISKNEFSLTGSSTTNDMGCQLVATLDETVAILDTVKNEATVRGALVVTASGECREPLS